MTSLSSEMKALSENKDTFRALFQNVPQDRFSVGFINPMNEGKGITDATILEKPVSLSQAGAVSLLWFRALALNESWDFDEQEQPKPFWDAPLASPFIHDEFRKFVKRGAFSAVAPAFGRNQVRDLLDRVWVDHQIATKDTQTFCYGPVLTLDALYERLVGSEYLCAHQVMNEWNDESYVFETEQDYGFVDWGTSA